MAWVMSFAQELTQNGVQVVIDKYDLLPGHDANAFMERLVSDDSISKVIMVCDQTYAEKSDARRGGAGTEAQIITPQLYNSVDQNKFVAVIRGRDASGQPYVPNYYRGRIFIDLSDPSTYPSSFEELVRWIYNKPQYVRGPLGPPPSFMSGDAAAAASIASTSILRTIDAFRNGRSSARGELDDRLRELVDKFESFRVTYDRNNPAGFDDAVVAALDSASVWRNEYLQLVTAVAQYDPDDENINTLHRFLEKLLPYTDRMNEAASHSNVDYDTFRFIALECLLYTLAVFLKFERFNQFSLLVSELYYWQHPSGRDNNTYDYTVFDHRFQSLHIRNDRLDLRRVSPTADLLHDRNAGTGIEYRYVMTADFVLYLRALAEHSRGYWDPQTLLYSDRYGGAFETFARAKSMRYFRKVAPIVGVTSPDEVRAIVEKAEAQPALIPKWQFHRLKVRRLSGADELGTAP